MEKVGLIKPNSSFSFTVPADQHLERIDKFLANQFTGYSRTFFARLIDKNLVTINGKAIQKQSISLKEQDIVFVTFPAAPSPESIKEAAQNLDIEIVFEHPHFLILNKPADLVIHKPSHQSEQLTLTDWLMTKYNDLANVGYIDRPGIVHRLDKDTSGLIIVARTNYAHALFGSMFKQRLIKKTYLALVQGHPDKEGSINLPIGRHPVHRTKMATFANSNESHKGIRASLSEYNVVHYFKDCTLLQVKPHTGRTHQIRVHCAAIGHPIIGDTVYGASSKHINRQALHAYSLQFAFDGKNYEFTRDIPSDFKKLVDFLEQS
ncbi:MAG TPA: RluA family pseudouridine synthase [Candidatus Babeliales bacterium]|nr:RluA family pseudouridine synthase [Candidatus Babeliales bacterium]